MSTLPRLRFKLFGRPVSRVLPLLTLVLLPVLAPTVSAQVDIEVGLPIGFHEPYAPESTDDPLPSTAFTSTLANGDDTVLIAQGDFALSEQIHQEALERIGADLDEVVGVDAGTSGSPMYWLDLFAVDGVPYGGFTTSTAEGPDTVLTLFAGPVTSFADGLAVAQQNVTVGFDLIFSGVDPSGLQVLLNAALPQLEGGTGNQPPATPEEVADEFADRPGMVAEGSYVSPHHGFALTWNDDWILDPDMDAPVVSDVNTDFDQVYLTVDSPQ